VTSNDEGLSEMVAAGRAAEDALRRAIEELSGLTADIQDSVVLPASGGGDAARDNGGVLERAVYALDELQRAIKVGQAFAALGFTLPRRVSSPRTAGKGDDGDSGGGGGSGGDSDSGDDDFSGRCQRRTRSTEDATVSGQAVAAVYESAKRGFSSPSLSPQSLAHAPTLNLDGLPDQIAPGSPKDALAAEAAAREALRSLIETVRCGGGLQDQGASRGRRGRPSSRLSCTRQLSAAVAKSPPTCDAAFGLGALRAAAKCFESRQALDTPVLEMEAALCLAHLAKGASCMGDLLPHLTSLLAALELLLRRGVANPTPRASATRAATQQTQPSAPWSSSPPASSPVLSPCLDPADPDRQDGEDPATPPPSTAPSIDGSGDPGDNAHAEGGHAGGRLLSEPPRDVRRAVGLALNHTVTLLQIEWATTEAPDPEDPEVDSGGLKARTNSVDASGPGQLDLAGLDRDRVLAAIVHLAVLVAQPQGRPPRPHPRASQVDVESDFNHLPPVARARAAAAAAATAATAAEAASAAAAFAAEAASAAALTASGTSESDDAAAEEAQAAAAAAADAALEAKVAVDEAAAEEAAEADAHKFSAYCVCTVVRVGGAGPLLRHAESLPLLVSWLRSESRQVAGFAMNTVAAMCGAAPDAKTAGHARAAATDSSSAAAADPATSSAGGDVYASGWLDAKLVNEGVVPALVHLIACDGERPATHPSASLQGLRWTEVALLAVASLRWLLRHPPNRDELLRAGGLGALSRLARAACRPQGTVTGTDGEPCEPYHARFADESLRCLLALTDLGDGADAGDGSGGSLGSALVPTSSPHLGFLGLGSLGTGAVTGAAAANAASASGGALEGARLQRFSSSANVTADEVAKRLEELAAFGTVPALSYAAGLLAKESAELKPSDPRVLALRLLARVVRVRRLRPAFFDAWADGASGGVEWDDGDDYDSDDGPRSRNNSVTGLPGGRGSMASSRASAHKWSFSSATEDEMPFEAILAVAAAAASNKHALRSSLDGGSDGGGRGLGGLANDLGGFGRLRGTWGEAALLCARAVQLLCASGDGEQLQALVDAKGPETLLLCCRLAEESLSTALLSLSLAPLAVLAPLLLPDSTSVGSPGPLMPELLQAEVLQAAAPEVLFRGGPDPRERTRLRIQYKLLRVVKMPRPVAKPEDAWPLSQPVDARAEPRPPRGKAHAARRAPTRQEQAEAAAEAAEKAAAHAAEVSAWVRLQRSAVRGLEALAVHPVARTLAVDHCLAELVALAVGVQDNGSPAAGAASPTSAETRAEASGDVGDGAFDDASASPPPPARTVLVRSNSAGGSSAGGIFGRGRLGSSPADSGRGFVDPLAAAEAEAELRVGAENLLVALGFEEGVKDLSEFLYDAALLAFWFHQKRSLQHQSKGARNTAPRGTSTFCLHLVLAPRQPPFCCPLVLRRFSGRALGAGGRPLDAVGRPLCLAGLRKQSGRAAVRHPLRAEGDPRLAPALRQVVKQRRRCVGADQWCAAEPLSASYRASAQRPSPPLLPARRHSVQDGEHADSRPRRPRSLFRAVRQRDMERGQKP